MAATGGGRAAGAAAAAAAAAPPAPPPAAIRRYQAADHPRIEAITARVYGGTDTLAYAIKQELAHKASATILVAQAAGQAAVSGVVCAEERGACAYLFGLRVADEARGNGLATELMTAICQASARPGHIRHLLTTTIPQNAPAVRVIRGLGFAHSRTVDRWPQEPVQFAYEAAVGFQPNKEQPEQPVAFAPGQPNMLDHIPGARELLRQATSAMGVQPSDWVRCTCVRQLEQAIASIRQQQRQREEAGQGLQHHPQQPQDLDSWLPWVYEVFPVRGCQWVLDRLAAREVWLLPHGPSGPEGPSYAVCVVLAHSSANYRTCAGVVAAHDGAVAAALDLAASKVPHFVAYVDSGRRHSDGAPDPALRLPPVLLLGTPQHDPQQHMCFLVYRQPAQGWKGAAAGAQQGSAKL